jgi:hypothetical protein
LKPDYAEANFNLGNVLCNLKTREDDRREAGVDRFREAIRLRPSYIEPMYNLGLVLTRILPASEATDRSKRQLGIDATVRDPKETLVYRQLPG